MVKNPPASAGAVREAGSIPGSGRSLEGGMATLASILVYRIPMDGGAWQATVHRVAKSWTPPKQLSAHARACPCCKNATTSMKEYEATGLRF